MDEQNPQPTVGMVPSASGGVVGKGRHKQHFTMVTQIPSFLRSHHAQEKLTLKIRQADVEIRKRKRGRVLLISFWVAWFEGKPKAAQPPFQQLMLQAAKPREGKPQRLAHLVVVHHLGGERLEFA